MDYFRPIFAAPSDSAACGSPLLKKKTTTHLGQFRKSTGYWKQLRNLDPPVPLDTAQFITTKLYSLMVLLV